jgi:transcriptional regulator with XRE-family HTH domain
MVNILTMEPKQLKQWREANGYSQARLAKALSCHVITVSRWENGAREIPSFLKLALSYLELKRDKPEPKLNLKTKK